MKVVISTINPVKINATKNAFKKMFPRQKLVIEAVKVMSGVSDQPMTEGETLKGATQRAENALKARPDFDFGIGIESGVEERLHGMEAFAWVVVLARDGKIGRGRTGTFFLPNKVANLIKQGKELGEADDIVFKGENTKQKNGAVGILTGNVIERTSYYTLAIILALIPFKNKKLY